MHSSCIQWLPSLCLSVCFNCDLNFDLLACSYTLKISRSSSYIKVTGSEPLHHVTIIQLYATASMHSIRVPIWQTQSLWPVRTAHISVLLTVNIVSHNPAQSSSDIFPLNLQTITVTRLLSSGGEGVNSTLNLQWINHCSRAVNSPSMSVETSLLLVRSLGSISGSSAGLALCNLIIPTLWGWSNRVVMYMPRSVSLTRLYNASHTWIHVCTILSTLHITNTCLYTASHTWIHVSTILSIQIQIQIY